LKYLSDLRTAEILRNIPKVSQREFDAGRSPNLNALIPLGYLHINKLIEWVERDEVHLKEFLSGGFHAIDFPLNYSDLGYGVVVIVTQNANIPIDKSLWHMFRKIFHKLHYFRQEDLTRD
jgi:hypothetical protein